VLLHHVFGEVNGKSGAWGHAIGGMGAISDAIAAEARAPRRGDPDGAAVARVLVRGGRAVGVVMADGTEIRARARRRGGEPALLYTRLFDPADLDAGAAGALRALPLRVGDVPDQRGAGRAAGFPGGAGDALQPHHASGILVGDSLAYFERAYFDAKSKEHNPGWAREPVVEMVISSALDDTLAPPGRHVASLFCQHVNPEPDGGWDAHRETFADLAIATVDRHAPNFAASVLGRRCFRRWISSGSTACWAATSSTARWGSTSCSARGRCSARPITAARCRGCTCAGPGRTRAAA
jgi:phytoene dehydrogenase-like protein